MTFSFVFTFSGDTTLSIKPPPLLSRAKEESGYFKDTCDPLQENICNGFPFSILAV